MRDLLRYDRLRELSTINASIHKISDDIFNNPMRKALDDIFNNPARKVLEDLRRYNEISESLATAANSPMHKAVEDIVNNPFHHLHEGMQSSAYRTIADQIKEARLFREQEKVLVSASKSISPISFLQSEMHRQSLLNIEICEQQQLRKTLQEIELLSLESVTNVDRITSTLSTPKAILEKANAYTRIMEEFSDSKLVTIIRGIVGYLRSDKQIGNRLEKVVKDNISDELYNQFGLTVQKIDINYTIHINNENGEIDLVIFCDRDVIFLIEVKQTIDNRKISHFLNKNVALFVNSEDTQNNKKIYGAIAYVNSNCNAISSAKEQGLLAFRISDSSIVPVESSNMQQLCNLRFAAFNKPKATQNRRKKNLESPDINYELIHYSKNDDGTIPAFKVKAHPIKACTNIMKKFIDRYDRFSLSSRFIAEQLAGRYTASPDKFVKDVLLGWENITDLDGNVIPFSEESAIKLFKDLPMLYIDLVDKTYETWHTNCA